MSAALHTEKTIFLEAAEIASPAERAAFLERACGDDRQLRAAVEALLLSHQRSQAVLDATAAPPAEPLGTTIGPYKLLQVIGEGGMGIVYLAEQNEPVNRKVALKVIKPGMDCRQAIARFEAERQALAMMDHVNIARVFDAGATPSGLPYFVMELVHGVPITAYCDDNRLTPRQRLELFVPVCQAIQHAHQKGIIHRDIKPSNVMVTLYDGMPVPKVIDFGVAKATEQKLTERTLFTQYGTMIGTLEYMSPEQAEMSALGVDTRSDIYSLGVLLYELLTGGTPLSRQRVRDGAYDEVLRMIKEEEPPRPSTRLSDSGESLASISAQRQMEPAKLTRLVRGELDWIVMKTLEKDRGRRYETASDFAADVRRYLNDERVLACPPSPGYRFRKILRRNKGPVLAASLILLTLLGGIAGTTIGLFRAVEAGRAEGMQRQLAEANEQKALAAAEAQKKSKETAMAREAETLAVLAFVQDKVFAAARPEGQEGGLGREVTLRQAVEAALPFVAAGFTDQPLVEAQLRMTLGTSFSYLGDADIAAEQFEAARAIYARHRGSNHPDTLESMSGLGVSYADLGRHPEALQLREETLALAKAEFGLNHPFTLTSMSNLAVSYTDLHRHVEALKLDEETLVLRKASLGHDHLDTLASMGNLANSYYDLNRYVEALQLHEETLALAKAKIGPDHLFTLSCMHNLAMCYAVLDRHHEALTLNEDTLALRKEKLGPDHLDTFKSMNNLAINYAALGRRAEALQLHEDTLALLKAKLGPDHPETLTSMTNVADSYYVLGRHIDALQLRVEMLALMKAKLGSDHLDTLKCMVGLANSYDRLGRDTDALNLREETMALTKAEFGSSHPLTLASTNNLAASYHALGRHADALNLGEETLALRKAKLGPDHPDTLASMWGVAASLVQLDRGAEAVPIIDECVRRAAGQIVLHRLIPQVMVLRLRHFVKIGDAAGCLETADKWEALQRADTESLYNSACFRAVGAGAIQDTDKTPAGEVAAQEQADRAMEWLKQAVAAGFNDAARIEMDTDLEALRNREDFKNLVTELSASR